MKSNHTVLFDSQVHDLMSQLAWSEITWNESSDTKDMIFKSPMSNAILVTVHEILRDMLFPDSELTYARAWKGKTENGENRTYHSDKLWEIKNKESDKPFTNVFVLYYYTHFMDKGGLKFWNTKTNEKEIVVPEFGELVVIDEREDDVYHKVLEHDPNVDRFVASFGFNVS